MSEDEDVISFIQANGSDKNYVRIVLLHCTDCAIVAGIDLRSELLPKKFGGGEAAPHRQRHDPEVIGMRSHNVANAFPDGAGRAKQDYPFQPSAAFISPLKYPTHSATSVSLMPGSTPFAGKLSYSSEQQPS